MIQISGLSASYPSLSKNILTDMNIGIKSGEKIGIIGRTGAGKSSLVKLFWNGIDIKKGKVTIDGQDISKIELKKLRKSITFVSQTPDIFPGTLRDNINPTLTYYKDPKKEEEIVEELISLGFKSEKLREKKLDFWVDENGSNLSSGEKQIIAFERVAQSNTKIVILDEATASVDLQIEKKIDLFLKEKMKDKTVLIIAHRIQTVLECDRILAIDNGRVIEFDTPEELLKNEEGGYFSKIYKRYKNK